MLLYICYIHISYIHMCIQRDIGPLWLQHAGEELSLPYVVAHACVGNVSNDVRPYLYTRSRSSNVCWGPDRHPLTYA
jgi:hypothetical protein